MKTRVFSCRLAALCLIALLAVSAAGCATPVGVERVDIRESYLETHVTALSEREPSVDSRVVLHRYDLVELFDTDPEAVLSILANKSFGEDDRRDLRFAIAELEFLYADRLLRSDESEVRRRASDHFLVAAGVAYGYLFGDSREDPPGPYDRRFRVACDLYNRALGKALATGEGGRVELKDGERNTVAGPVTITLDTRALPWALDSFDAFFPADGYAVRGLTVRNRTSGLGAPLIALRRNAVEGVEGVAVPVTAFLRFSRKIAGIGGYRFEGTLELHSAYEETEVAFGDRRVPLETDSTAPIAYMLDNAFVWRTGYLRFLGIHERVEPGVSLLQPYQPGRIPVVFVHGTASSQVWWAEMINTLRADPILRKRCQFWYFQYNSSLPVLASAEDLRRTLARMVKDLDPDGRDRALERMVVIGHSQGGLLSKMTAVRTGDRLWGAVSDKKLEDTTFDPKVKEQLRNYFFIEPLPFVDRVVFIATPHRGSYLADNWVRSIIRGIVSLPADIVYTGTEIFKGDRLKVPAGMRGKIPSSVDGMSPENPILMRLAELPIAPGVKSNSIIAVKGEGDYRKGNDGVVEYRSAHLDDVESEFVLNSGHSCQGHPLAIEEVRRILLLHVEQAGDAAAR